MQARGLSPQSRGSSWFLLLTKCWSSEKLLGDYFGVLPVACRKRFVVARVAGDPAALACDFMGTVSRVRGVDCEIGPL